MWVLALDTTTRDGSVALVHDDVVVVARSGEPGVSHAERVPSDLRAALADAGLALRDIDLFAVASGPGGFTGLRIGLAAVQGLATALDRPTAGVPSLAALAWDLFERDDRAGAAGAWIDASRGEVFAAAYGRPRNGTGWPLEPLAPPTAASPGETLGHWRSVVPVGAPVAAACRETAVDALANAGFQPLPPVALLAGAVGRIAGRIHAAGLSGPAARLAPEYVRRPDVEIERDRQRGASPLA